VLKPQDGAGSWLTFGIANGDQTAWNRAMRQFEENCALDRIILQPWIAGQHLSMGCLCGSVGEIQLLPLAVQDIEGSTFQYRGGSIPATLPQPVVMAIEQQARSACQSVPGLSGYVGVDVILPDAVPHTPMIVEINPRLTTSYVGYRQLCRDNIAARMLPSQAHGGLLRWQEASIEFNAGGDARLVTRGVTVS
jgi:predicted ATP-grasp superfamily ATP-dependent carboligase